LAQRGPVPVEIGVERLTVDELHREERRAARAGAGVDQARDVRMIEAGEYAALLNEAAVEKDVEPGTQNLHRGVQRDAVALARGAVDDAETAGSDPLEEVPSADRRRALRVCVLRLIAVEGAARLLVGVDHAFELRPKRRLRTRSIEETRAIR